MMREEYSLTDVLRSPIRAALSTFAAFVLCGAVPLLPFAFGLPQAFQTSIVVTGCVFGLIGALKSQWSLAPAWRSAIETALIGTSVAYILGHLLKTIV